MAKEADQYGSTTCLVQEVSPISMNVDIEDGGSTTALINGTLV